MKKFFLALAVAAIFIFVTACSGGSKKEEKGPEENQNDTDEISDEDGEPAETDGDTEPSKDDSDKAETTEPLECENFAEGLNENLMVGEGKKALERSFILRLPEKIDSGKKFPVVFLYHGYGDTADNFEQFLSSYVDNETMPFILVVPEARSDVYSLEQMSGLDWDMMNLTDDSAEADMFDAVLACIDKKWGVDKEHIHVSGFSAGAITANSIALQRPEKVASILSYSGAYFSDEKSRDALGSLMGMMNLGDLFSWPDFEEEHTKYPQVFVFGDKEDDSWGQAGMFTIYFNKMGRLGASYLTENGHDAILCEHDGTHTVAGISQEAMIKFFKDHPFGTEKSSYREKMPEDFAEICHFFTEADLEGLDDDDDGDEDTDPDAALACADFKEGLNKNLMAGKEGSKLARDFYLHLPKDISSGEQFPVIFFYHPYAASASDVDAILSSYVNNKTMPFILVLPEARKDKFSLSMPPTGLDWDIINLNDGSAEADMFDAVISCLESKGMVDAEHIHLSGFSAGAIAANSVALMRSEKIASVLTYSGAYFSDKDNLETLGSIEIGSESMPIGSLITWPDFEEEHNKYTQMLVFGAKGSDTWSYTENGLDFTIDFNEMAENDGRYLQENGHGAILCNHNGGHEPQVSQQDAANLIQFFYDHPLGTDPSPYKTDMPETFSKCIFKK